MPIQMKKSAPLSAGVSTGDSIMLDVEDMAIEEQHALQTAQHAGTYMDSDSEDSDSDLSGGEIDSDIEKERQYTYDRTLYREDYQVKMLKLFVGCIAYFFLFIEIEKNAKS